MSMTAEERYQNDAQFRSLVELMKAFIKKAEFTPTELREAAILAATMNEMEKTRPNFIPI